MATVGQIRAAIAAKVAGVANIGRVHDYQRYEANLGALAALYRTNVNNIGQVRGWHVTHTSTREDSNALGRYTVTHDWQVRGFMSLDDVAASEKTFDDLVEAVRDAFRSDENLGGLVSSTVVDDQAGVQADEIAPVMFCGVLCHAARLSLRTRHYL